MGKLLRSAVDLLRAGLARPGSAGIHRCEPAAENNLCDPVGRAHPPNSFPLVQASFLALPRQLLPHLLPLLGFCLPCPRPNGFLSLPARPPAQPLASGGNDYRV